VSTPSEQHPAHAERRTDDAALEEIRQLFARYRRLARHGVVAERDAPPGDSSPADAEAASEAPAPA
jgi:hypothetical protein